MDPLSFFAAQNEAEQAKSPSEFEVDERRRESIRMSRTSNDIGGLVGVGFSISSTSKRNSCDRKSKSDRIDNSGNRNSTPKPTSALPTPPRVQPKESKKNENENENTEKEDIPSLDTYVSMLSGETTIIKLPDVIIQLYQTKLVPGTLFMTVRTPVNLINEWHDPAWVVLLSRIHVISWHFILIDTVFCRLIACPFCPLRLIWLLLALQTPPYTPCSTSLCPVLTKLSERKNNPNHNLFWSLAKTCVSTVSS